jgi:DNA repair protein RecN (Recombination protein N)
MIRSLHIRHLATIEDVDLNFKEGFSIITGETGTGKSIIIGGIKLALGEKGSADMIRTGEKETTVEAIFFPPPESETIKKFSLSPNEELLIQRRIIEDGTGRGYVNGTLFPLKNIKKISFGLVDIYGQNDHIFLHNTENQLFYLDNYAGGSHLKIEVSGLAQKLRKMLREKRDIEAREAEKEQRLDFLEFQINEISNARLNKGEEEDLRQKRNILKNAEKIYGLVEDALSISYAQDTSIAPRVAKLQQILADLSEFDKEFKEVNEAAGQFGITIREFSDFLLKFKQKHEASPEKLESIEQRLSQIERLKRKYGKDVDEILLHLKKVQNEHDVMSTSKEKLEALNLEIEKNFSAYKSKTKELSDLRRNRAIQLEKEIKREAGFLGMKKARFKIDINALPQDINSLDSIRSSGADEVEFLISPNPGEELKPLRKIASGGELSRIMLALKSIGKGIEESKVFVFDEIDSGIGGKTAEFVARKLKDLSTKNQVICITHLPQIASFATHHYKIEKTIDKNRTYTIAKKLKFSERVEEIARLSAGSHMTETALKNAKEMLERNLGLPDRKRKELSDE